jgi:D-alanine--poly(phosphoribitol) ligase subunit 2
MALNEAQLVQYLRHKTGTEELDAKTSLFSDGTVDSVGMIDLIVFIESEAGIEIAQEDVTMENFDTVSRILAFVAGRTAG